MKILLDTHMLGQKQTGNERYWKNLAFGLKKYAKNHQIILYSNLTKSNLLKEFSNFEIFTPKSTNGLYRIFFGFNQAIKKYKPDLIHVQNFAPFIKTCSVITTIHDLCFKENPSWFSLKTNLTFKYFFKRSLDLSDAIICVSKNTKNSLLKYYKINPKKIFVIYEAADPAFYFIKNKNLVKKNLWNKFKIRDEYFLVVGNIEDRKCPFKIIESFNNISFKYPYVKLVFVGPNKLNIKPTKNIKILGYISDKELNFLYNGAISLIYLSLCEGFGLPIVEATKAKTPVICSDIPVSREITDGNAILVKNNKQLTSAMAKFIKNKDLRKKYSSLAYNRSKFFSWKKTVKETLDIYRWVLNAKVD